VARLYGYQTREKTPLDDMVPRRNYGGIKYDPDPAPSTPGTLTADRKYGYTASPKVALEDGITRRNYSGAIYKETLPNTFVVRKLNVPGLKEQAVQSTAAAEPVAAAAETGGAVDGQAAGAIGADDSHDENSHSAFGAYNDEGTEGQGAGEEQPAAAEAGEETANV
jgi:hypothetical protein